MRAGFTTAIAAGFAILWVGAARADLVTNGGFETETPPGCQTGTNGLCNLPPPGWTANDGVVVDTVFPNSGTYDVAMGNDANGAPATLSQTLSTAPAQTYNLTFYVFDESADPTDSFTVSFGNFSATITGDKVPAYTQESFTTAPTDVTAATTALLFTAINGLSDFNLDDVAVTSTVVAVPEAPSLPLMLFALVSWLGLAKSVRQRS